MASRFNNTLFDCPEVRFEHFTVQRGDEQQPMDPIRGLRLRFLDKHGNEIGSMSVVHNSGVDAPVALRAEER